MKYLIMNQNFLKIKLSLFHVFGRLHEFSFLGLHIYVNKATLLMLDWNKYASYSISFCYLLNREFFFS